MKFSSSFLVLTTAAMLAMFANGASAASLVNPGFENPATPVAPPEYFGATGWTDFGGGTFTVSSVVVTPNSGNQSLKLFGGTSGVFQEFPASPGQTWDAGAWVLNDSGDPMAGGQVAAVNIEWHGAGGLISFLSNGDTISTTPQGVWTLRPVSGVAPAGTTAARIVLITGEFGGGGMSGGGGAPKFDDAFFGIRQVPEPGTIALAGIGLIGIVAGRVRRRRA